MMKRRAFLPIFIIVAIVIALSGFLFTEHKSALAQGSTPAPIEEPEATEEPAPTEAAPTPAPAQEVAPAQAAPTAAPVEEAAPTVAAPVTLPTTGVASDPGAILLVILGTVAVLGTLSGYSARRKGKTPE